MQTVSKLKLTPEKRDKALRLYVVKEYTKQEIADYLEVSISTIKRLAQRDKWDEQKGLITNKTKELMVLSRGEQKQRIFTKTLAFLDLVLDNEIEKAKMGESTNVKGITSAYKDLDQSDPDAKDDGVQKHHHVVEKIDWATIIKQGIELKKNDPNFDRDAYKKKVMDIIAKRSKISK